MKIIIEAREIQESIVGKFLARHLRRFSVILSTGKVIDICHYRSKRSICSSYKDELSTAEKREYNDIICILEK